MYNAKHVADLHTTCHKTTFHRPVLFTDIQDTLQNGCTHEQTHAHAAGPIAELCLSLLAAVAVNPAAALFNIIIKLPPASTYAKPASKAHNTVASSAVNATLHSCTPMPLLHSAARSAANGLQSCYCQNMHTAACCCAAAAHMAAATAQLATATPHSCLKSSCSISSSISILQAQSSTIQPTLCTHRALPCSTTAATAAEQ
jgi:hypothetical protein